MSAPDEIVVTGLGIVSPVGADAPSTMSALLAGRSGVRLLPESDSRPTPVRLHAPVDDASLNRLSPLERRRYDRAAQLALQAGREAWQDAGAPDIEPERLAVVVSSGMGGFQSLLNEHERWQRKGGVGTPAFAVPGLMPNIISAIMALDIGARAGAFSLASACASGSDALAYAFRLLRDNEADVVVAGGTEAVIHPLALCGFAAMRALSGRHDDPAGASRPFDRDRDGFVLGEGSAILVLEQRRHAAARGARMWARLLSAGTSADAHHLVAPEPTGRGAATAISKALRSADAGTGDVVHVSAHATGTPVGDLAEARAIRLALGSDAEHVPVTALKSCVGHLLGASGALAAAVTAMSLRQSQIPSTRNLDTLDAEIDLDIVRREPRTLPRGGAALATAFGFGGHNVALLMAAA